MLTSVISLGPSQSDEASLLNARETISSMPGVINVCTKANEIYVIHKTSEVEESWERQVIFKL